MTEREKMLAGKVYDACAQELEEERVIMRRKIFEYNSSPEGEPSKIKGILGKTGMRITVIPPFHCDYGSNIEVGEDFFSNFNFTVLDENKVIIGNNVFIGPNVSIYTACHPLDPGQRRSGMEWAEPVSIGNDVWIGGSVTICPGVHIGNNVTVGAGSVVVRDIPSNCVAVGNPARVIKYIGI